MAIYLQAIRSITRTILQYATYFLNKLDTTTLNFVIIYFLRYVTNIDTSYIVKKMKFDCRENTFYLITIKSRYT